MHTLQSNDATPKLRIVQWATGNIGRKSLQAIIQHPNLDLVGLYVHSQDKVGQDAGSLCGLEPCGVLATDAIEQVIALRPDCVLYMPQGCDYAQTCQLLAAGINLVTTRVEFHHPPSMSPELKERVERACLQGNSSIHSTGSSPGFVTEALPLVLTSLQRRLDKLTIDEFADLQKRNSPELLFKIMGFGQPGHVFDERHLGHIKAGFAASLRALADALGLSIDDVQVHGEVAHALADTQIAAGTIARGTVAAQRIQVDAYQRGKVLMQMRFNWYCSQAIEPAWDLGETGWRVRVLGDTPLDVNLKFDVPLEQFAQTMPGYTAHRAVNSVAAVVAANSGIITTAELPTIIADLGTEN